MMSASACAACKHQRRKCSKNCLLAPYFPVSKTKDFENVHRLFGVFNVTKSIMKLQTKAERDEYVKSIITEAYIRTLWPVHGCTAVIADLFRQLELADQELHRTQRLLHAAAIGSAPGQLLSPEIAGQESGFGYIPTPSASNDVTIALLKPMYMWDENAASLEESLNRQLMKMPNNPGQEMNAQIMSGSGQEMESNALAGQELGPEMNAQIISGSGQEMASDALAGREMEPQSRFVFGSSSNSNTESEYMWDMKMRY